MNISYLWDKPASKALLPRSALDRLSIDEVHAIERALDLRSKRGGVERLHGAQAFDRDGHVAALDLLDTDMGS